MSELFVEAKIETLANWVAWFAFMKVMPWMPKDLRLFQNEFRKATEGITQDLLP